MGHKIWENYDYIILKIYISIFCVYFFLNCHLFICQQIPSIVICLLFQALGANAGEDQRQVTFKSKSKTFLFVKTHISLRKSDSLISCSHYCARDKRCKSANFIEDDRTCSLLDKTRLTNPLVLLRGQVGAIHIEKVDAL